MKEYSYFIRVCFTNLFTDSSVLQTCLHIVQTLIFLHSFIKHIQIKVNRYISMAFNFYKDRFCDFLFYFLENWNMSKKRSALKGKICSSRSKLFPLRVDTIEKGGKNDNDRIASP